MWTQGEFSVVWLLITAMSTRCRVPGLTLSILLKRMADRLHAINKEIIVRVAAPVQVSVEEWNTDGYGLGCFEPGCQ